MGSVLELSSLYTNTGILVCATHRRSRSLRTSLPCTYVASPAILSQFYCNPPPSNVSLPFSHSLPQWDMLPPLLSYSPTYAISPDSANGFAHDLRKVQRAAWPTQCPGVALTVLHTPHSGFVPTNFFSLFTFALSLVLTLIFNRTLYFCFSLCPFRFLLFTLRPCISFREIYTEEMFLPRSRSASSSRTRAHVLRKALPFPPRNVVFDLCCPTPWRSAPIFNEYSPTSILPNSAARMEWCSEAKWLALDIRLWLLFVFDLVDRYTFLYTIQRTTSRASGLSLGTAWGRSCPQSGFAPRSQR